ncbi:MAG: hypothetical protein HY537_17710 [Deltaproteobacteria bacterium]|nr:hypothetical protein [Deltaproteobacteria bacterium]
MNEQTFIAPESTIYRQVSDELVVIQLDTGFFFYFSPETSAFLDFFRQARTLADFLESIGLNESQASEKEYIHVFIEFLTSHQIIIRTDFPSHGPLTHFSYCRPVFYRKGERVLDEVAFLCP